MPQPLSESFERGDKAARHAAVLAWQFPHTLYAVASAGLWRGYPPADALRLPASAVVALGSADGRRSRWLQYSLTQVGHDEDGGMVHTIILLRPGMSRVTAVG